MYPKLRRCESVKGCFQACTRLKRKPDTPKPSVEGSEPESERSNLDSDFIISMDDDSQEYLVDELPGGTPIAVSFDHFIPTNLAVMFNKPEEIIKTIINAVTDPRSARQVARHINPGEIVIPQEIINIPEEERT